MDSNVMNALNTVNCLLPILDQAESQFKSARNWSFLDVLGGGFIVDMIKHYKLGRAGDSMEEVNYYLQQLGHQLGQINIPDDYRMQMGGFLTFADFCFDGFLVDAYMTSKIMGSIDQIKKLKGRLLEVKKRLENLK